MNTHLRNHLKRMHYKGIEKAIADVRAGRIPVCHQTGRDVPAQLRHAMEWRQNTLRSWKSSPPRQRGYFMYPDVVADLLVECAAFRRVMKALGISKKQIQ